MHDGGMDAVLKAGVFLFVCCAVAAVVSLAANCRLAPAVYYDCEGVDPKVWNETFKVCTGRVVPTDYERAMCKKQADELLCERKVAINE